MKFNKGDLVKWYIVYDVGVVKSSGIGIVLDNYNVSWNKTTFPMYRVLRNEHDDVMVFEEYTIEKYNGEKNEIK